MLARVSSPGVEDLDAVGMERVGDVAVRGCLDRLAFRVLEDRVHVLVRRVGLVPKDCRCMKRRNSTSLHTAAVSSSSSPIPRTSTCSLPSRTRRAVRADVVLCYAVLCEYATVCYAMLVVSGLGLIEHSLVLIYRLTSIALSAP